MKNMESIEKTPLQKFWAICCSLKLAIYIATAATILIMVGSLVMHYNPSVYGGMEDEIMGLWLPAAWKQSPALTFWMPLTAILVVLFAINTLCCLIDWLTKFSSRWRKSGEYLIHLGFILLTIAYIWGSVAGFRSGTHNIFPGETIAVPNMPGYSLRLNDFEALMDPKKGMPLDMISQLTLLYQEEPIKDAEVKMNHPLLHDGLIIFTSSFGQALQSFRFFVPGAGMQELKQGSQVTLGNGTRLRVLKMLPDARVGGRGQVRQISDRLGNPAMFLSILTLEGKSWQGWYFLRERPPAEMTQMGATLRPIEPVMQQYSILSINRDPSGKTAMAGGVCLSVGVVLAFFSFYRKRSRGDRPEV